MLRETHSSMVACIIYKHIASLDVLRIISTTSIVVREWVEYM